MTNISGILEGKATYCDNIISEELIGSYKVCLYDFI